MISRPRTGLRPTTARPASARPAAPRIRERNEAMVPEESAKYVEKFFSFQQQKASNRSNSEVYVIHFRLPAGKVNVIEDKDTSNDAEDDNLISLETTNDILLEEISVPPLLTSSPVQEGEHGHLVEQILEVKKELEDDGKAPFREEKTAGKTEIVRPLKKKGQNK